MNDLSSSYHGEGMFERVLAVYGEEDGLMVDELTVVDEFHVLGRGATRAIGRLLNVGPHDSVVDI